MVSYTKSQLAHRIPQTKANLKKYGKKIIHNQKNLTLTCCLECDAAVSISNNPGAIKKLIGRIESCLDD